MLHLRQADRRPMGRVRPKNKNRRKPQRRPRQFRHQKILLQAHGAFQRGDNRRNSTLLRRNGKKKRSPQPVLNALHLLLEPFSYEIYFRIILRKYRRMAKEVTGKIYWLYVIIIRPISVHQVHIVFRFIVNGRHPIDQPLT
jgi:hypothetical protein